MKKKIHISDSEWEIMKVLWKEPGLTLKEIDRRVSGQEWSYTTVRTLVTRLAEKGAIAADKSNSGSFKYSPLLSEGECRSSEVKSFLDRVFDGSKSMLVASLTSESNLTEEEKKSLLAIIEKMDE